MLLKSFLRPTLKGVSAPQIGRRGFSAAFLAEDEGCIDILHSDSNDINFNLATEEYLFEHCNIINPVLFLYRNTKTIIIGKHQNPWKEC